MAIPTSTTIYGSIVPNRIKNDSTLKTSKITGLKYPLEPSPKNGYYSKQSGFDLIKSSLRSIIRTERGERFMLPEYGCNLKRFLMEPIDQTTFGLIKDDILVSIGKYLGKVTVNKLQIIETRSNTLNVKLFCSVRDNAVINFDVNLEV